MNHQTRVYNSIFEMMPSVENPSPMVRINRLNPSPDFILYAKLEWYNPLGSVKDRAAWFMLRDLEERGEIGGERGLVEPAFEPHLVCADVFARPAPCEKL